MKISQLQEDIKNYKFIGHAPVAKKVVWFAKRFAAEPDRDLDLHEKYALAYILFEEDTIPLHEEGFVSLLRHQIWDDPDKQKSDKYCADMYRAAQLLKEEGLYVPLCIEAIKERDNCLEIAKKLVELDPVIQLDTAVMAFMRKYPHGYLNAADILLRLAAYKIYFPDITELLARLVMDHDTILNTCLPALRDLDKEGILFKDGAPDKRILELFTHTEMQINNLVTALKMLRDEGLLYDDTAINSFLIIPNLNPVIVARRIICQTHPHYESTSADEVPRVSDASDVLSFFAPRPAEDDDAQPDSTRTPELC